MTETLYWITRLDGLHDLFIMTAIISGCVIFAATLYHIGSGEGISKLYKKILKYMLPMGLIAILGVIFVPTTKDALMIYGVGSTLEYLKQNETAKELPDKCIEVLDAYIESLNQKKTQ
jgi:uncharacterized membrane protein